MHHHDPFGLNLYTTILLDVDCPGIFPLSPLCTCHVYELCIHALDLFGIYSTLPCSLHYNCLVGILTHSSIHFYSVTFISIGHKPEYMGFQFIYQFAT